MSFRGVTVTANKLANLPICRITIMTTGRRCTLCLERIRGRPEGQRRKETSAFRLSKRRKAHGCEVTLGFWRNQTSHRRAWGGKRIQPALYQGQLYRRMGDDDGDYRRSEDYRRRAGASTTGDAAKADVQSGSTSTFGSRLTFYAVSALCEDATSVARHNLIPGDLSDRLPALSDILALKGIRAAVPHLVPVMAADLGFTFEKQGVLLASFFQGYFVTMIPAAKLTTLLGAKAVMTGCLGGGIAVFALLPTAARRFGSVGAQALFLTLGLIQGGFTPALSTMNANFIPADGQEKVWAIRGQTFAGDALCQIVASVAVPALCSGGRWVRACSTCAGAAAVVTLLWQLLARDSPTIMAATKTAQAQPGATASPDVRIAWGIFKLPPVQGICGTWLCCVLRIATEIPTFSNFSFENAEIMWKLPLMNDDVLLKMADYFAISRCSPPLQ